MANILITGASSGIGFETARALAQTDHHIVALARSREGLYRLQETSAKEHPGSRLHVLPFDLLHGDYENTLFPFLKNRFERIDVLINNAGALLNKPFEKTSKADFSDMLQYNFLAHVNMIQQVLPRMSPNSHIVNIGSMGGFQGSAKFPGLAAYSASKAALHTLTECLAVELADSGIHINCLALGSAQTEMLAKAFPGYVSPVTASEMGAYIAHFALNGHRLFNGKVLPVAVTTP